MGNKVQYDYKKCINKCDFNCRNGGESKLCEKFINSLLEKCGNILLITSQRRRIIFYANIQATRKLEKKCVIQQSLLITRHIKLPTPAQLFKFTVYSANIGQQTSESAWRRRRGKVGSSWLWRVWLPHRPYCCLMVAFIFATFWLLCSSVTHRRTQCCIYDSWLNGRNLRVLNHELSWNIYVFFQALLPRL